MNAHFFAQHTIIYLYVVLYNITAIYNDFELDANTIDLISRVTVQSQFY